jgi:hypothetical protein
VPALGAIQLAVGPEEGAALLKLGLLEVKFEGDEFGLGDELGLGDLEGDEEGRVEGDVVGI